MRNLFKASCGVFVMGASLIGHAVPAHQYQAIVERNVFGLKAPPQEVIVQTNNPPAGPKLYLTGITTILGNKLAMMQAQFPGAQGQPPREQSLMLAEGQREAGIEVRRIDEVRKTVEVDNSGTIMPLTFEKDGLKTPAAPPAPGATAAVTVPGASNAPTQVATVGTNALMPPVPYPAPRVGVGRTLRLPNAVAPAPEQQQQVVVPTPAQSPAAFGTHAAAARDQANGVSTQLTPEEEQLLRQLEQSLRQQAPQ
jgi:hypothetical protein